MLLKAALVLASMLTYELASHCSFGSEHGLCIFCGGVHEFIKGLRSLRRDSRDSLMRHFATRLAEVLATMVCIYADAHARIDGDVLLSARFA